LRHYPKPIEPINVADALERAPLPGRYAYGGRPYNPREETAVEKKREFERVKRDLRRLASGL